MITLKTLAQATEQEIFDQVVEIALEQQKRQMKVSNTPHCLYRSAAGFKCFAGMLIGDDEYRPEFERKPWRDLVTPRIVPCEHAAFIGRLQSLHDCSEVSEWGAEFEAFAKCNGLIYNGEKKDES